LIKLDDIEAWPQGHPKDDQGQGNQEQEALASQIQALFSFLNFRIYTDLGNHFEDGPVVMIG